eukprot:Rhum_TRINITY_DN24898_c0_g1::Rhum_TRINITY_DN24898_c0_g1_i1::g.180453::m.180453
MPEPINEPYGGVTDEQLQQASRIRRDSKLKRKSTTETSNAPDDLPGETKGARESPPSTSHLNITADSLIFAIGGLSEGYTEIVGHFTLEEAVERVHDNPSLLGFTYKGAKGASGKVLCIFKFYGAGPNTDPEWSRYSREDFYGTWYCSTLIEGMNGREFHSYNLSIFQGGLIAVQNDLLDQKIAWHAETVPSLGKTVDAQLQGEPSATGPTWIPCSITASGANTIELAIPETDEFEGLKCTFLREYMPPLTRYRLSEMKRTLARKSFGQTRREQSPDETDYPYNTIDTILFFIHPHSKFRRTMVAIVDNRWFDYAVLVIIALNALALVLDDPLLDGVSWLDTFTTVSEITFQVLFTIEMLLKILALGFVLHPGSYLRTYPAPFWNRLDFVIVVAGYIGLIAGSGAGFPALRLLRCLRPLRTLNRVRELRQLMSTLSTALPLAVDIFYLFFLLIWVFSILGIQLFSGNYHRRCYVQPGSWNTSSSFVNFATPDGSEVAFNGINGTGNKHYDFSPGFETRPWLVFNDTDVCGAGLGRDCECNDVAQPQVCQVDYDTYHRNLLTFDNIFKSMLLTFKIMSLDDWPDDMKHAQDSVGHHAWIFFFFCTLLGNVFAVNLILAVLSAVYSFEREHRKVEGVKPILERLTPSTFLGAVVAHPLLVVGVPFMVVEEQADPYSDGIDDGDLEQEELEGLADAMQGVGGAGADRDDESEGGGGGAATDADTKSEGAPKKSPRSEVEILSARDHVLRERLSPRGSSSQPTPVNSPLTLTKQNTWHRDQLGSVLGIGSVIPGSPMKRAVRVVKVDGPEEAADATPATGHPLLPTRHGSRLTPGGLSPKSAEERSAHARRKEAQEEFGDYTSESDTTSTTLSRPTPRALSHANRHASVTLGDRHASLLVRDHSLRNLNSSLLLRPEASPSPTGAMGIAELLQSASERGSGSNLGSGRDGSRPQSLLDALPGVAQKSTTAESEGEMSPGDRSVCLSDGGKALAALRTDAAVAAQEGAMVCSTDQPVNLPGSPEQRRMQLEHERKRVLRRVGYYKHGTVGNYMFRIAKHKAFNLFLIAVTVVNIALLSTDHYNIDRDWERTINVVNFVCVCIFILEAVLKLVGMTPTIYFSDNYNCFDFVLVLVSIPELANPQPMEQNGWGGRGVTALRGFRLARVFRLAKKWKGLNRILKQISTAVVDVGYLSIIVILFLFCFSVMGARQFSCNEPGKRCHFENLGASSLTVFIVLTGENWATIMEETLERSNWVAVPYFVLVIMFGNYILLNLLIAILIDSFQPTDEDEEDQDWWCCRPCLRRIRDNEAAEDKEEQDDEANGSAEEDSEDETTTTEKSTPTPTLLCPVLDEGELSGTRSNLSKVASGIAIPELSVNSAQVRFEQDERLRENLEHAEEEANALKQQESQSTSSSDGIPAVPGIEIIPPQEPEGPKPAQPNMTALVVEGLPSGFGIEVQPATARGDRPVEPEFRFEVESATTHDDGADALVSTATPKVLSEFQFEVESATDDGLERADSSVGRHLGRADSSASMAQHSLGKQPATPEEQQAEFRRVNGFLSAKPATTSFNDSTANLMESMSSMSSMVSLRSARNLASPRRLSMTAASTRDFGNTMKRSTKQIRGRSSLFPNSEFALSKGVTEFPQHNFHKMRFKKSKKEKSDYAKYMQKIERQVVKGASWEPVALQQLCYRIVSWRYFAGLVYAIIAINIVFISIDCPWIEDNRPGVYNVLRVGDYVFVSLFTIEMVLKILAWGWVGFIIDKWNMIDAIVVVTSIIGLVVTPMRSFRSLRVLRLVTAGSPEMKVVLQSVIAAMPSIQHVIFVSTMVWFIFAVVGTSLFKGSLYECSNPDITTEANCTGMFMREAKQAFGVGYEPGEASWQRSWFNFDNVFESMFSLFQIAVGEKWREMLYRTMDAPGPGEGPRLNSNYWQAALFYVAFIVLGQFFFINLFIGVLIQSFAVVKAKCGNKSIMMSESQRNWMHAQRVLLHAKLHEGYFPQPSYIASSWFLSWWHYVACSKPFEALTTFLIVLNAMILALQHYGQPDAVTTFLDVSNWFFVVCFTIEAVIKIVAFSVYYFADGWNRFDFLIVAMSWVSTASSSPSTNGFRVLRVGRMLRLLGRAEGLKTIVATMMSSLPSLVNIAVLLLVNFFVFGVFGVDLFGRIVHSDQINQYSNFENLYQSLVTLYQVSTTETWNDIMMGTIERGNCHNETLQMLTDGIPANCEGVSKGVARAYFVLFLLLGSFIFLNLFIYVLIEHFEEEKRARDFRSKTRDLEAFDILKREWLVEDPGCTGYVRAHACIQLLQRLPEPLWLSSPFSMGAIMGVGRSSDFLCTQKQLRSMLIPLDKQMRVRYADVVKTLALKVFGISIKSALESHFGKTEFSADYWNIHHYHAVQFVSHKWFAYLDVKRYERHLHADRGGILGAVQTLRDALAGLKNKRKLREEGHRSFVVTRMGTGGDEDGGVLRVPKPKSISAFLAMGVYSGELDKQRPHGTGTLIFSNNAGYYQGDWVAGQREGSGVEMRHGSIIQKGEWRRNVLHGAGLFANCDDGYVFEGHFDAGVPSGPGVLRHHNGVVVQSQFSGSYAPKGEGTITVGGEDIEGVFEQHGHDVVSYMLVSGQRDPETLLPTGKVTFRLSNGDLCTVTTSDGSLTGVGEMTVTSVYPNETWKGEFRNGVFIEGEKTIDKCGLVTRGTYNELTGRLLDGEMGLPAAQLLLRGMFIPDLDGPYEITFFNGAESANKLTLHTDPNMTEDNVVTTWEGEFEDWRLNGTGVAKSPTEQCTGVFAHGGLKGFSKILYASGIECHGHFADSKASGWAKISFPNFEEYQEESDVARPPMVKPEHLTYWRPPVKQRLRRSLLPPLRYTQSATHPPSAAEFKAQKNSAPDGRPGDPSKPQYRFRYSGYPKPPCNPLIGVFHSGILWHGPSVDGNLPHGEGTAYLQSGLFFAGEAHAGSLHKGEVWYPSGKKVWGVVKFGHILQLEDGSEVRLF